MSDSLEMTIEFLRARLLSERSVSRSARQRADQFAKRVVELEEQLRIVTIQRKKAEKAAAEVLAILKRHGTGEFSEVIDSSSDRDEVTTAEKESYSHGRENGSSDASRLNAPSEVEQDDESSITEFEASVALQGAGKSLSWKSDRNVSNSHESRRLYQVTHRRFQSSPRTYWGKSCRQIKRKDSSASELGDGGSLEIENEEKNLSHHAHGIHAEGNVDEGGEGNQCSTTGGVSESKRDDVCTLASFGLIEQEGFRNTNNDFNGDEKDEDMERALEKQAKLIDQYQEEEKAQREWEENLSNISRNIVDSSRKLPDDRNQLIKNESALKQQKGAPRVEQKYGTGSKLCIDGKTESTSPISNEFASPSVGDCLGPNILHIKSNDSTTDHTTNGTDSNYMTYPGIIQGQGSLSKNFNSVSYGNCDQMAHADGFPGVQCADILSSGFPGFKSSKSQVQVSLNQSCSAPNYQLDGVLNALHHAKHSPRQNLNSMSDPTQSAQLETLDPHMISTEQSYLTGIPIITAASLFRLPTDAVSNSAQLVPNNYRFSSGFLGTPPNHVRSIAPVGSYFHLASSESHPRPQATRKLEVNSLLNAAIGSFPCNSHRSLHSHSDFTMLGSYSSHGVQKPFLDPQHQLLSGDQYLNRMNFPGHR